MNNLIIVGAGGFGLEVAAYAEDIVRAGQQSFTLKGFLDDTKAPGTKHGGYPILGPTDMPPVCNAVYVIAVGTPENRKILYNRLEGVGTRFATLVHPACHVAATARLGVGTVLAPFSLVGPETQIGAQCVLNVYTTVGHEGRIGDFCVLSPYASVHGAAALGSGIFMGGQAFVTARTRVGDNVKISAGSVVYNDIPNDAMVMGNPAVFRQNG